MITLSAALLIGCGNRPEEPAQTQTTTEAVTAATTEESTPAPTTEVTTAPETTTDPTPESTEAPSTEVTTESATETATTEVITEPATEAPTTEPAPQYTYTDMTATMYAQQAVNVRDLPDTSGNKLGGLSINDEVAITGQCNETGWYQFEYNGSVAYVSNNYVGENKVEVQQTQTNGEYFKNGLKYGAFNEADFPTPFQVINKGGLNVYYVMGYDETLGSRHEQARRECDAIVAANLGIETGHPGCGTYYWFDGNGYINGSWVIEPNENGVTGLFFPYYQAANGDWLGESPETKSNYD